MRVIVTGGRSYREHATLFRALDEIHKRTPISGLAQGGASGADDLARKWCAMHDVPCTTFAAEWGLGAFAGPQRNARMLDDFKPDLVVAFDGGAGTASCCRLARERGIQVQQVLAGAEHGQDSER